MAKARGAAPAGKGTKSPRPPATKRAAAAVKKTPARTIRGSKTAVAKVAAGKKTTKSRAGKAVAKSGSSGSDLLDRVRALCAALPETTEVMAWGHPTFRVGDKIFAGFGQDEHGSADMSLGVKTTMDMQAALVSSDARFSIAKYVGKHGWISMRLQAGRVDWNEVDALIRGSYRLIAPTRLVQRLDESGG